METEWDTVFIQEIGHIHKERTYDGKLVERNLIVEEISGWIKVTSTAVSADLVTKPPLVTFYNPKYLVFKR